MFVMVSAVAVVLLLVMTMALIKSASAVSRHEEQAELERWMKMKAATEVGRAKSEDDK